MCERNNAFFEALKNSFLHFSKKKCTNIKKIPIFAFKVGLYI